MLKEKLMEDLKEAMKEKKILKKNVAFKLSATFFYLTLH